MEDIQRIEHGNCLIRISYDDDPPNPRTDWDNLGTMLYVSRRYVLGDKEVSRDEIQEITERDDVIWIPVYAFVHGSIALSANASLCTCPWDSGQCGIIYVEKDKAKAEWAEDYSEERVREVLKGEVKTYSQKAR
jgi:hypothetical protein